MKEKMIKSIKIIVTIAIVLLFVWFLVVSPMLTFRGNEKKLENAARRYFELNPAQLPTGERIKTLSLKNLYHQSYIEGDLYIPYTHKTCSIDNSWVKVRRENGEYKYYTYLECGILSSTVDHKGPVIKLNGDMEQTVDIDSKYKDPGIKSIVDNTDGTMKSSSVTVKSEVDTSKVGTYEITYTAFDSMSNKTTVTRKVTVVKTLYTTIKNDLKDQTFYSGDPLDNYARISNMMFRIYAIDGDKDIILVADEDIANVSYSKLDEWLKYYYNHLNEATQKMIVKKKYCNMTLTDTTLDTTSCSGYTEERDIYIPSVVDINKTTQNGYSYLKPITFSWTANSKSKKEAYVAKDNFYDKRPSLYSTYDVDFNYGVRPMFAISGKSLIHSGTGTADDPYTFGDSKKAKGSTYVNERFTGEFISIDGDLYRIVEVEKDGTTRVIAETTVGADSDEEFETTANPYSDYITYDPKDVNSIAYFINNTAINSINTSYFVNHEVEVPVYKNKILFGEEAETKKVKVKVSAPNMFEMFSAQPQRSGNCSSYWLVNISKKKRVGGAVTAIGVPLNEPVPQSAGLGIRVVGYLKKGTVISSGDGTYSSPYIIR